MRSRSAPRQRSNARLRPSMSAKPVGAAGLTSTTPGPSDLQLPPRTGVSVIPWRTILGNGERPLDAQTPGQGQGLVVLLGPLESLITDLPVPPGVSLEVDASPQLDGS